LERPGRYSPDNDQLNRVIVRSGARPPEPSNDEMMTAAALRPAV
jgi:hypothetical protein